MGMARWWRVCATRISVRSPGMGMARGGFCLSSCGGGSLPRRGVGPDWLLWMNTKRSVAPQVGMARTPSARMPPGSRSLPRHGDGPRIYVNKQVMTSSLPRHGDGPPSALPAACPTAFAPQAWGWPGEDWMPKHIMLGSLPRWGWPVERDYRQRVRVVRSPGMGMPRPCDVCSR